MSQSKSKKSDVGQQRSQKRSVKNSRFSRIFIFTMMLFLAALGLTFVVALKSSSDNKARYLKIVYGDLAKSKESTNSVQNRALVQKQIFFSNKKENYELLLGAKSAELFLTKCNGSMEIAELMHDVECTLTILNDSNGKNFKVCLVKAAHADYSTKQVVLKGDVYIECTIGTLKADTFILERTNTANFDRLELIGNVEASLIEEGKLYAERAFINLIETENLAAIQQKKIRQEEKQSSSNLEDISKNKESRENLKGRKVNLWTIQSQEMNIDLIKGVSGLEIDKMQAKGKVSFTYDNKLALEGDFADFRRREKQDDFYENSLFDGVLTLLPSAKSFCKVSSDNSLIYATQIDIDTLNKLCTLNDAKGSLFNSSNEDEKVTFSSDKLVLNNASDTLTLSGNTTLTQEGVGTVTAFEDVKVNLFKNEGKLALNKIETVGDVTLDYTDSDTSLNHTLKSYGTLKIDHQKKTLKLVSPKDFSGKVIPENQVYFEDAKGDILADRAFLKYEEVNKKLKLDRIVLEGEVKIKNRLAVSDKDKTLVKQYILAERVDFLPGVKEMILKAPKGERVLLFDEANHLQVSARALKIIRDRATKKESLEGYGDIRMSFAENEFKRVKNFFNQENRAKEKSNLVPNRF